MNIQLIDRKSLTFRVDDVVFQFYKPYYICVQPFTFVKAVAKGSTLYWNIKGIQISYNHLKRLVNNS